MDTRLPVRKPRDRTTREIVNAIRAEGPTNRKELAARYGVSEGVIYRALRNLIHPDPNYTVPQFEHTTHQRKLTWEQVRAIRAEYPSKTMKELAAEHGCSVSIVRGVVRNETYRDPDFNPRRPRRRRRARRPSVRPAAIRDFSGLTSEIPPEGESISPKVTTGDYRISHDTGCWLWQRRVGSDGPIVSRSRNVKYLRAHREYYRRRYGDIPSDVDLVRSCDEIACVNPDHYQAVPHDQRLARWHQQNRSPLTPGDVQAIREGAKAGVKQYVFELRYGISSSSVSKIVTNQTWKDPSYVPGVEKTCALPECRKRFATTNSSEVYCTSKHQAMFNWRLRIGYYDRLAERKAQRRAGNATRRAVESAWSLDGPVRADSATTLGDLVAADGAFDVTVAQVEASFVRELLNGLTVDEANRLDEDARRELRLLLAANGVVPSVRQHVTA